MFSYKNMFSHKGFLPALLIAAVFLLSGCASSSGNASLDTSGEATPTVEAAPEASATPAVEITSAEEATVTVDPDPTPTATPTPTEVPAEPNIVVVLDPGHGGKFTGAIYDGKMEKDLTLTMANHIRDYLTENYKGIEVYLTRETDIALDPDLVLELEQRAIIAKEHNADYFVSLHFNACEAHNLRGATVYCSFRDNVHEKSYGIARSVLDELVALGLKDNSVQTRKSKDNKDENGNPLDYYAVIRHNANRDIPGIIVEHCFMDNEYDKQFMNTPEKLKELSIADAKGIASYLELEPVSGEAQTIPDEA